MAQTNKLQQARPDLTLPATATRPLARRVDPRLQAAELRLLQLLSRVMETASWDACRYTGAWLGLAVFHAGRSRRDIAMTNVRLALPQLSEAAARQIARRSAQNFGMTLCEFLHLRAATRQEVRDYADIDGLPYIQAGFERGRGVLLLTAHLGNWEVMGARAAQEFPLTVVARPAGYMQMKQHIDAVRRASGIDVISKYDTARASLLALRANGALGILPDQHGGPEGLLLPLFGQPTRVTPGLARLALLSKAPIVPAFGVRRRPWLADGRIVAKVSPGFYVEAEPNGGADGRQHAVVAGTRQVHHELECVVRAHPDQWLWMHRRWRAEDVGLQKSGAQA